MFAYDIAIAFLDISSEAVPQKFHQMYHSL